MKHTGRTCYLCLIYTRAAQGEFVESYKYSERRAQIEGLLQAVEQMHQPASLEMLGRIFEYQHLINIPRSCIQGIPEGETLVSVTDHMKLCELLIAHGFKTHSYSGETPSRENHENYARYLLGHALENLREGQAPGLPFMEQACQLICCAEHSLKGMKFPFFPVL
ncbi:MAG: hypothetical protein IT558_02730 [Alphaproteobacteria bacterium]|nr:hypothetical protein [Alphaproteobacteria bacterium]